MSVIGGSSPVITNGLVYALDFGNTKTFSPGNTLIKSSIFDTTFIAATANGPFNFDGKNLIFTGSTSTYIQRPGTIIDTTPFSNYTLCMLLNVVQPGSFLVQNTSTVSFAAQISTSSFDIGYYNNTSATYYTRRFPVVLNTGSLYVVCRYSNGTIDLFLNGIPVSSSQSNIIMSSQVTGSNRTDSLFYPTTGSLFIGALPSSVSTFSGSLAQFYIYNRALTSDEIYSNYTPHITSQYQIPVTSLRKPYTLDENTLLYVSASGISSSAYITAVDSFITGLKTNGLWNKLSAIYPYIGSTTASQAINLKEPGINRLVYSGSWSASLSGSTPISSNSYLQLSGFDYPAIVTSSAHLTYLSYDLPRITGSQVTASLVAVDKPLRAIGGEIFYSGSKTYHVFRTTGTSSFRAIDSNLTAVEVLVIAGGGSGGEYTGGGGGAGGLVYSSSFSITGTSSINIIVGAGAPRTSDGASIGFNGENSSFSTITAFGGGGGGTTGGSGGKNGGSGGGGGAYIPNWTSGGSGSVGQGNNGADGVAGTNKAGGGGGAGTAGIALYGGSGSFYSQYAGIGLGSPAGWFAGGGGTCDSFTPYPGGIGGGGTGLASATTPTSINDGVPNTGGGGGGTWPTVGIGSAAGGSGIVVVSYNTNPAAFTSSFGLSVSGSNIIGNLHSTTTSGIAFDSSASIGLVTVSRTGSLSLSVHKDITSSVINTPVTASILGSVYGNASNFAGTLNKVSPYTISYLSYGSGMTPTEVNTYHSLASKLQYDLGRALLINGYPAAVAYSVRQLSKNYPYAINVRRGSDDLQQDIGFVSGDLDTGSLLTFLTASVATPLPGDIATPAVAYSLRKVRTLYTGSVLNVRRDYDNLTFDVGFDVSGNLDTGSLFAKMTGSLYTPTLPGDYSGLAVAYSLRRISSSYSGYILDVRRASDNYSASIGYDTSGNLNTGSLSSFIQSGSEIYPNAYSGLTAAYSVRRVVSTYTGSLLEVRSGSVSQSIGFTANGDLDVAAIRSFAGSGDAFVSTWYDQSGNGYHLTQPTAAYQPKLYSGSLRSVVTKNSKPAIRVFNTGLFNAFTPTYSISSGACIFAMASIGYLNNSNYNVLLSFSGTSSVMQISQGSSAINTICASYGTNGKILTSISSQTASLITIIGSGSDRPLVYNNQVSQDTLGGSGIISTIAGINLGSWRADTYNSGTDTYFSEILFYTSSISSSRSNIENNINTYYGTFTTSSATTESAYISKWYDQSISANHATQYTASVQPLIVSSGSLITYGGRPAVSVKADNDWMNVTTPIGYSGSGMTFFGVGNVTNSGRYFSTNDNTGIDYGTNGIEFANSEFTINYFPPISYSQPTSSNITTFMLNSTSHSIYTNGSLILTASRTVSSFTPAGVSYLFRNGLNYNLSGIGGTFGELLLYQLPLTASRTLIEDNINSYYSIYSQSLASGSGYVTTWYDQSGNNNHVTQTTYDQQPLIITSGSIYTSNSKPAINIVNSTRYLTASVYNANATGPTAWFITYQLTGLQRQGIVSWGPTRDTGINFEPGADGPGLSIHKYSAYAYGPNSSAWWSTDQSLFSWISPGGLVNASTLYLNNSPASSSFKYGSNANINVTGSVFIGMGSSAGAAPIAAKISEVILYVTDQAVNRPIINNNINNYYNAYVPNTVSSSMYVTKWYDQSGNGNHATQTTSSNQPAIIYSGSLVTQGPKASLRFSSSFFNLNSRVTLNDFTSFWVAKKATGATNGSILLVSNDNNYYAGDYVDGRGTPYFYSNASSQFISTTIGNTFNTNGTSFHLAYANRRGNQAVGQYNGSTTSNYLTVDASSFFIDTIANYSSIPSYNYSGSVSEIIIHNSDQSNNRTTIESNINSYYNIY